MRGWTRRRLLGALAAVVGTLLLAPVVAELSLRFFWPSANNYFIWPPGLSVTFEPSSRWLPGVDGSAAFRVNSMGLRGPEPGPIRAREYRILAIGGSTTECLYIDQPVAWPELVGTTLRETHDGRSVWVGNGGSSGFSARDHRAFTHLALPQYDVDALLVLVGVNDVQVKLLQGESYDTNFVRRRAFWPWAMSRLASWPWYLEPDGSLLSGTAWLEPRALSRLSTQVRRSTRMYELGEALDQNGGIFPVRRERRQKARTESVLPSLDSALEEYGRNLRAIVKAARQRELRIILMTQPSIWREEMTADEHKYLWAGSGPGGRYYYTTGALAQAMAAYNDQLLAVCAEMAVECFDLAAAIPKSLEAFFDDMHFNIHGSRLVAWHVADYLSRQPPLAPAATGQLLGGNR